MLDLGAFPSAVLTGLGTLAVTLAGAARLHRYLGATPMAIGLLGALAVLPLRAVVLEAGRSLGKGRPSVESEIWPQ